MDYHLLTVKQFRRQKIKELRDEFGLTWKKAEENLIGGDSQDHYNIVRQAATEGKPIPKKVLDSLEPDAVRNFLRHHPEQVPDMYIPKHVRDRIKREDGL
jgi:hypothetical protein